LSPKLAFRSSPFPGSKWEVKGGGGVVVVVVVVNEGVPGAAERR
jgi:hypothetical protein